MKILTTTVVFVIVVAAALATTGCPDRVSIADIERNPGKYQNKDIAVAGTVRDSYGVSIPGTNIGGGAYKIDDGTGSIWVIVSEGSVPAKGTEMGVSGRVGTGVNWKGRNYGLGMYEKDRKYKRR
jgi:hypothetical protein